MKTEEREQLSNAEQIAQLQQRQVILWGLVALLAIWQVL